MACTPMVGKWTRMQDMALPQVLVLLVQHEMHNTAHIMHNNAYITQGNVVVLGCVENKVNKGIKILHQDSNPSLLCCCNPLDYEVSAVL